MGQVARYYDYDFATAEREYLEAARRYDEAIELYKKVIELDPNFMSTHFFLARAYEAKGMYDEAVKEYSLAARNGPALKEVLVRDEVYKKSGWNAYLQTILDQLVEHSPERRFTPFVIATFYARANKKEEALAWLERL